VPGHWCWCGERLSNLCPPHSRFEVFLLRPTAHRKSRDNARLPHRTRYSQDFKLDRVWPSVVADGIADCQIRVPTVPIVFCETRKLAQEWTYASSLPPGSGCRRSWSATSPCTATKRHRRLHRPEVRRWATANDIVVSDAAESRRL
jgi:hypothetical protein